MTDGGSALTDDELLAVLGAALDQADPVPPEVLAAARGAYTWRTIEAELAALVYDSSTDEELAGVRGGALVARALTFEYEDVVVELEVDETTAGRVVTGQVAPAPLEWIELHQAERTEPIRLDVDELGRFRTAPLAPGPFRLLCRFRRSAPFAMLLTEWVVT
jgi:hypothetical protein